MKIMFTDESMESIMIESEEGVSVISYPPVSEEDKKLVEDFGGDSEIRKASALYARELEEERELFKAFCERNDVITGMSSIDAILNEELDRSHLMKIKLSMFEKDIVKVCKNKELLTGLRKADDIVDIMMYYGMIRNESSNV